MSDPWPVEVRLDREKRHLRLVYEDGRATSIPAELLRCESPSAEVQGHSPAERKLVAGQRDVTIAAVEPIGNYAVRLIFSDGHATGIYGWPLLAELGADPAGRLARYHSELAAAGQSPGPPRR